MTVLLNIALALGVFLLWRFLFARNKLDKAKAILEQREEIIKDAKELVAMSEKLLAEGMPPETLSEKFLNKLIDTHEVLCLVFKSEQYLWKIGKNQENMVETSQVGESVVALVKKLRNESTEP